jgi:GcrA cell cycle regulator
MWTPEETEALTDHFKTGLSALDSAKALSKQFGHGFTKNMVIGRRRRLGLVYGASAPEVARINSARALGLKEVQDAAYAKQKALEAHRASKREQVEKERLERDRKRRERAAALAPKIEHARKLANALRSNVPAVVYGRRAGKTQTLSLTTKSAVMGLQAHHCKYPVGDIGEPSFKFCCEPRQVGSPYCAHHRSICTVRMEPKSQMLARKV